MRNVTVFRSVSYSETDRHGLNEDGEKGKQTSLEYRSGKNKAELSVPQTIVSSLSCTGSSVISPIKFEMILKASVGSYQLSGPS